MVDAYAARDLQEKCDPNAWQRGQRPGVIAFRDVVLARFGGSDGGVGRSCADGGQSEHKEARAWDWMVPSLAVGSAMLAWLLTSDDAGNQHARARRAGVMYVIFNRRIYRSYAAKPFEPERYNGPNPHTDHVHVSFSWDGALGRTTGVR